MGVPHNMAEAEVVKTVYTSGKQIARDCQITPGAGGISDSAQQTPNKAQVLA